MECLPVPLEAVLSTEELLRRPARKPDYEALSGALIRLAKSLATSPDGVLQEVVQTALELSSAHSAGMSLLEEENGRMIFRWHGVAGQYAPHLWGITPREFSPCGTVLDTDAVQLMSGLDRHFTYFSGVEPSIVEALLIPFHVSGVAVGAIWVISHDLTRQFDAEDARVIQALGEFASAAYQVLSQALVLKSIFATIPDPLLVLDGALRVQTASRSFYETFQSKPDATEGHFFHRLQEGAWDVPELRKLLENILPNRGTFENLALTVDLPPLGRRTVLLNARTLQPEKTPAGRILLTIKDVTGRSVREAESPIGLELPEIVAARPDFEEIVGSGKAMNRVLGLVEVVAPTNATVLILGETGTGKELIARAVHKLSPRRNAPFITLNCAAIPTGLLESELFGYEKGAFTGALGQKIGRFEMANRGTLFLDEVGDIPLELQPKLLRALQEKSFERLGGTRTIPIDVRLVAATNRDLRQMMRDKLFRGDLFYRLLVFPIVTPPLRERPEEIPALTWHFTRKYAAELNRTIDSIPAETMKALMSWPWPGNVRELENFIERSVILSRGSELRAPLSELEVEAPRAAGLTSIERVERDHILRIFRETGGVVSSTATRLGIPRAGLNAKMKKLGISRKDL